MVEGLVKLALIGYGRMGRAIEAVARSADHDVVVIMRTGGCLLAEGDILDADVYCDFSHPNAVVENVKVLTALHKQIVVGTTGWLDRLQRVRDMVETSSGALIYGENFSLGAQLFIRLAALAAAMAQQLKLPDVDLAVHESHHRYKEDTPSGTALKLGQVIIDNHAAKKRLVMGGQACDDAVQVSSTRCGSDPGTHTVVLDTMTDSICLTHTSRSREAFALGAVFAAEWIQERQGFYSIEDLVNDYF